MSRDKSNKFSCLIVGDGTLPIRCAEILLRNDYEIRAIVSADAEVKKWAKENKVSHLVPGTNLAEQISEPFDYLFSIVNQHILRDDVLGLPRKLAINYHDALLPRYAGTHATSWALMNGETSHGISWHIITDVVDAGDVLKQEIIEISKNDTALTLNTKCYEAAIKAFDELVDDLSNGKAVAKKQNLEERTFFPRFKRPVNGGVISWNKPAAEISAFVRALNFGNHPNPLGVPKFSVKNDFFIVSELEILHTKAESAPGTINEIGENFLRISSVDKEINLRKILRLDGQPVSITDLAAKFELRKGCQFANPNAETVRRIEEIYKAVCKQELHWARKLPVLEPAVPPFAKSTAASDSPSYVNAPMPIPIEVLAFLEKSPKEQEITDFVLAAFGALLARLGGIDNFDVGYSDSKTQSEIAGLENLFATQVPLRFSVDCLQNFTELSKNVEEEIESAEKHKTYAQDIFARFPHLRLESSDNFNLPVAVAKVERFDAYQPLDGNGLTLLISENESACRWIYDRNRIDGENVERLTSHFATFLKGIAADPESQIAYLPLLTEPERHQLLVEWNDNHVDYPKDKCIHQLFEAQVNRTPDAIALIFGDQRLTYRELNRRANQLARHLQNLGVEAEVLVGICVERSVEMIVGILGILKAGGAYVPLDPAYPQERIEYMLADSGAPILVTLEKLVDGLNQYHGKVVLLDKDAERIAQEPNKNPFSLAKGNNLAYVIYTSGSTGNPKGVLITHSNVVRLFHATEKWFGFDEQDVWTMFHSYSFDFSVWELWGALVYGGRLVIVPFLMSKSPQDFYNLLCEERVTVLNQTPSAFRQLIYAEGSRPDTRLSLRYVIFGGEALDFQSLRPWLERHGTDSPQLVNMYGITETTVHVTFRPLTVRDIAEPAGSLIGNRIPDLQIYILDNYLQPSPIGVPGEMYVAGAGVARGYLNRPELTNERFTRNPFSLEPESRLYKTGDLARYLSSGDLEYLGRIDNQVKIRGFRIELGEIETMLLTHPGIRETVVIASTDQPEDKRLVAYFVSEQQQTVKTSDLRDHLKQTLPDYMIPSAFVELDELPLTPNGKINRKALPAPTSILSESDRKFVAYRDDLESKLVKIWETLLGVQPIGVKDDFFDLGGHSLQAVRMFAEVETTFGKNIPLATLFEAGTIEKLADILRQEGWAEPESSLVPIQPNGTKPIFFCVHAKGGNVLFYRDLAKHLGEDQPFYGIQARRLGGRQVGHATVEEMAEFYIKEMRVLQPQGPYYLGGSSFGGLAIFEIAQQLHCQGQKVALLALFDTGTPNYPKMLPNTTVLRSKIYGFVRRIQHHCDSLKAFSSKERADYILDKLKKVKLKYHRKINNTYKKAVRKFYLKTKGTGSNLKNYFQIEDQIWKAGLKYQPQIYPGKMTLFRASNQPLGIQPDATLGWENLVAGGIEIHEVPGHHGSIVVEPYVRVLAEKLTDCIELAQAEKTEAVEEPRTVEADEHKFVKAVGFKSIS